MISFNSIPLDVRTPGAYVEFDASKAISGLPAAPSKILVIGQRLAAGAIDALVPTRMVSAAQAAQGFGRGSQLAAMVTALKKVNDFTECWAIALDDDAAGVAASGTITVTGPALAAGSLALMIAGTRVRLTDLALFWTNEAWSADIAMAGADLATDDGLRTAVIVSLFTDARARDDDPLPAPEDRRGWWGDALPAIAGDRIGSRLWLLRREKRLQPVVARARDYVAEALQWLIEDGIAERVDVEAEAHGLQTLAFAVTITRPEGRGRRRFDFTWEATQNAV